MAWLDPTTVMVTGIFLSALCCAVMVLLWRSAAGRLSGIGQMAVGLGATTVGMALMALRHLAPNWLTVFVANVLPLAGYCMGYHAIERFIGCPRVSRFCTIVTASATASLAYFSLVQPSFPARFSTLAVALLLMSVQGARTCLVGAGPRFQRHTRPVGWVYAGFAAVAAVRLADGLTRPTTGHDIFTAGAGPALTLLSYSVMFVALTFFCHIMANALLVDQVTAQEERLRTAFLAAPYGIGVARAADGVVTDANQRAADLADCRPEDLVGQRIADMAHAVGPERRAALLAELEATGGLDRVELRHTRADGSQIDLLVTGKPIVLPDGDYTMFCVIDVTGLKRTEDALRDTEESYRLLAEMSSDIIILHGIDGVVRYANPAALALTGVKAEALGSLTVASVVPPEALPAVTQRRAQREAGDASLLHYELEVLDADGRRVPMAITSSPVLRDGRPVSFLIVARDLTETRRAERERTDMLTRLARTETMEEVGRLAGGVAHDLNNLLTGILQFVSLAKAELEPGHPVRLHLDEITHNAERSAAMARKLLAFARMQPVRPSLFNMNELIASMTTVLARLVGEDITVTWLPTARTVMLHMDPRQLDQILINLVVNARDAMPNGGRLTLETSVTDSAGALFAIGQEPAMGGFAQLTVTDTGAGMDKEVHARLFEPFFTTKPTTEGAGLGLATVYGIVSQNGGSLSVDGEPGRGSAFRVYLPISSQAPAAPGPAPAPGPDAEPRPDPGVVLVVDDEKSIRISVVHFLKAATYTVTAAEGPDEAIDQVEKQGLRPDLLVTDVTLPALTGPELLQRLRRSHPGLRCLLVSGYGPEAVDGLEALDAGFLGKPFTKEQLLQAVAAQLRPSGA